MATVKLRGKTFSINKTLGKGAFGQVYKVKDAQSREFALKCIKCTLKFHFKRALSEIRTLKRLSHPNVLKIHLADVKSGSRIGTWVYILTEFYEGGNLKQRLARPSNRSTEYKWITQLADALTYLHTRNPAIAHRDLKPDNVLLTSNDDIKLADFGLAREYVSMRLGPPREGQSLIEEYTTYMTSPVGTPSFMAPEVFAGHYTLKADVFSLGLIFYTILERRYIVLGPWTDVMRSGDANARVSFTRRNGQHRVSKKFRQIVRKVLRYNPNSRPTAQEIYDDIQSVTIRGPEEVRPEHPIMRAVGAIVTGAVLTLNVGLIAILCFIIARK